MATVHVGSVWSLRDCLRSSVPIKWTSQKFYHGELRSGQFRDLPTISLWGNKKMLPVSHKPTETIQLFQDHSHSPYQWWSRCNWRSGVKRRSTGVKWGHKPFFANKSRQNEDKERKWCHWFVEPLRGMYIMHTDPLGSCADLDLTLTWPDPRSYFEIDLSRSKSTYSEPFWRGKHDGFIFIIVFRIKNDINDKPSPWKTIIFHLMPFRAKTIDLSSNLTEKR